LPHLELEETLCEGKPEFGLRELGIEDQVMVDETTLGAFPFLSNLPFDPFIEVRPDNRVGEGIRKVVEGERGRKAKGLQERVIRLTRTAFISNVFITIGD
jgi:hypothetical protein